MRANERRAAILEILCRRREETMQNLADEFHVTRRTILSDIDELTLSYPIQTTRGRFGGGVKVADGYYIGRKYLKPSQLQLLQRLAGSLTGSDLSVMNSILSDFALITTNEKKGAS